MPVLLQGKAAWDRDRHLFFRGLVLLAAAAVGLTSKAASIWTRPA